MVLFFLSVACELSVLPFCVIGRLCYVGVALPGHHLDYFPVCVPGHQASDRNLL